MSSPCEVCAYNEAFKRPINPHYSNTLWRCGDSKQCCDQQKCDTAECVAQGMGETFARIAALEYPAAADRIAYQYFGSQDVGMYTGWPAVEWCSSDYDPRFRPWYASAASGPKDVVIVIDMSGSMANGKRTEMAKAAAKKVLNTLSWIDYVSLVSFDNSATAYSSKLQRVTPAVLARMERWVDNLRVRSPGWAALRDLARPFWLIIPTTRLTLGPRSEPTPRPPCNRCSRSPG